MPLGDHLLAVGPADSGVSLCQAAGVGPQTHGTALLSHIPLLVHQGDDRIRSGRVQLGRVGARKAGHMAGKLNHRHLHAQADPQEGHIILPGIPDGGNLALHAAVPKAAGHKDAVAVAQQLRRVLVGDLLCIHPFDVHLHAVFNTAVGESLGYREIGVVEGHVLAHQGDAHRARRVSGPLHHSPPLGQVGGGVGQAQPAAHRPGQPFLLQHEGHLIEDRGGQVGNHILRSDIAEEGDLLLQVTGHRAVAPGQNYVGLDAQPQQLLH